MNKQLKSILGSLLFVGAIAIAPTADAGFNIGSQKVTQIAIANGTSTLAYVEFDGSRTGTPACGNASPQNRRYVFDTANNRGKALLSVLTAAMYAQRPVYATGTNTCTTASYASGTSQSIENLQSVSVER